ncbi:MAG: GNAT family N-acetyltransferase [Acidimicrobiales bacterium]
MSGATVADSTTSPPSFRRAGRRDVAELLAVVESAYRGEASRRGWTTEADLLDGQRTDAGQLLEAVDADGSLVLVAERDGELVGCCQLVRRSGTAELGLFAVRPGLQGGGIGRALVAAAEALVREEWSAAAMSMKVIAQRHDVLAWYRRLGYQPTGATAPFPYGDERFGVPRRADLFFVVLEKAL